MNSELIETFITVANAGNITKSANLLFVSQATVSHRIKQLEEKVGVQLILRTKGSKQTNLTIAGKNFLPLAQKLVSSKRRDQYVSGTPSILRIVYRSRRQCK